MDTRYFNVDPQDFTPDELSESAQMLRRGGLVAFPTETVYGIAAAATQEPTLERLRELKSRPADKAFTLHIPDRDWLLHYVSNPPALAHALIDLYWPGPLTLIFQDTSGNSLGVRLPSHPVAREFLRQAEVPVVAPSANPAGDPPALSGEQTRAYFDGRIDAIIDGGPCAVAESSTLVRLSADGKKYEVLREGLITESMIRKALDGRHVLFVCTGNSCRSPMAELLFKNLLAEQLGVGIDELATKGYRVSSCGLSAIPGGRASEHSQDVMTARGLDLGQHRSRPISEALAEGADIIICLSNSHLWQLKQWRDDFAAKAHLINDEGVVDPIGGTLATYEECARDIEHALKTRWLEKVLSS